MPLATRLSSVARTVRTATVGTGTSASSPTVPPSSDRPSAILATRPSSARSTIRLASVHTDRGNNLCWPIVIAFLFRRVIFDALQICSFLFFCFFAVSQILSNFVGLHSAVQAVRQKCQQATDYLSILRMLGKISPVKTVLPLILFWQHHCLKLI